MFKKKNFLAESLFVKLKYQLTQQKLAHGCHFHHLRHWKEVNVEKLSKGIEPMTVCFLKRTTEYKFLAHANMKLGLKTNNIFIGQL